MSSAGVLLEKEGKVLLQLRDNFSWIHNPGVWGIFGGSLKKGENFEDAAIREIWEELGIRLKKKDLSLVIKTKKRAVFKAKLKKELEDLRLREGQIGGLFSLKDVIKAKKMDFKTRLVLINYFFRRL